MWERLKQQNLSWQKIHEKLKKILYKWEQQIVKAGEHLRVQQIATGQCNEEAVKNLKYKY